MRFEHLALTGMAFSMAVAPIGAVVLAQTSDDPPARIGNEWDGQDHQPTRHSVGAAERSDGVLLSPRRSQAEDQELNAIQRQILRESQQTGGATNP